MMFKRIHEKYGVLNGDVSGAEVYDALVAQFPHLTFKNNLTTRTFVITTRSGIAKLAIGRAYGEAFHFRSRISPLYQLLTLGFINVFAGIAGHKDMTAIRAFCRERFHISQKA
jgi:hypothetical protein